MPVKAFLLIHVLELRAFKLSLEHRMDLLQVHCIWTTSSQWPLETSHILQEWGNMFRFSLPCTSPASQIGRWIASFVSYWIWGKWSLPPMHVSSALPAQEDPWHRIYDALYRPEGTMICSISAGPPGSCNGLTGGIVGSVSTNLNFPPLRLPPCQLCRVEAVGIPLILLG